MEPIYFSSTFEVTSERMIPDKTVSRTDIADLIVDYMTVTRQIDETIVDDETKTMTETDGAIKSHQKSLISNDQLRNKKDSIITNQQ